MYRKFSDRICLEKDDLPSGISENAGSDRTSSMPDPKKTDKTPVSDKKKNGVFVASIVVAAITAAAFVPLVALAVSLFPPILRGSAENLGEGLGLIILIPLYLMCSAAVAAASAAGVILSVTGFRKTAGGRRVWFLCDLVFSALLLALTVAGIVLLFAGNAANNSDTAALAAYLAALWQTFP